ILAQGAVAREQIAHRMVLTLDRVRRRDAGDATERVFGQDLDLVALLRVQFLGPPQLVALRLARKPFLADDEHRRLRADFFGRRSAETGDERARILAAERTELSSENDEVTREGLTARQLRHERGQFGIQDEGE